MGPKQEINPLQMAAAGLLGPNLVIMSQMGLHIIKTA